MEISSALGVVERSAPVRRHNRNFQLISATKSNSRGFVERARDTLLIPCASEARDVSLRDVSSRALIEYAASHARGR